MKTMKKFKYNLYFKRCLIILFLLTLFIYISAISYVHAVSNDISGSEFKI